MSRISEPGVESLRSQLGIEPEDPDVFYPVAFQEAVVAARLILRDDTIPERIRQIGIVGIAYELAPMHLRPSGPAMAAFLGIHRDTLRAHELEWEATCDEDLRFDLTRRAWRAIAADRKATANRRRGN